MGVSYGGSSFSSWASWQQQQAASAAQAANQRYKAGDRASAFGSLPRRETKCAHCGGSYGTGDNCKNCGA